MDVKTEQVEEVDTKLDYGIQRQQLINIIKDNANGQISDADLKKRLPDLNPRERVKVINELTEHNVIELVQRGDQLEYKYKKQIHFPKGVEVNEQPIYRLIAESATMGIWKRDIRKQIHIDSKELTKTLTQMEKKKLIKKIGSGNTMKVRFILFDTEPDRSITGGAFYEGDRFDRDLVEGICTLLRPYMSQLRDQAKERTESIEEIFRLASVTPESIAEWVNSKNFVKFKLTQDDTQQLLESLVAEGTAERRGNQYYTKLYSRPLGWGGLSMAPCGVCPLISQCRPGGLISPESCQYLDEFLY